MDSIHAEFRKFGLVRPQEDRLLGGVLAGLGRRIGLEPWPTRIAVTAILLMIPGSQILLYPILWVLMPTEQTAPVGTGFDAGFDPEFTGHGTDFGAPAKPAL